MLVSVFFLLLGHAGCGVQAKVLFCHFYTVHWTRQDVRFLLVSGLWSEAVCGVGDPLHCRVARAVRGKWLC
eukprot:4602762-Pyramimonas_sp.AAC.1